MRSNQPQTIGELKLENAQIFSLLPTPYSLPSLNKERVASVLGFTKNFLHNLHATDSLVCKKP